MKWGSRTRCKNLHSNNSLKILLKTGNNGDPILKPDFLRIKEKWEWERHSLIREKNISDVTGNSVLWSKPHLSL